MERKYSITSGSVVMSMVFTVQKADASDESLTVHAAVDLGNEKVYFVGDQIPDIDYKDLELEILHFIQPQLTEGPELSPDILARIAEIRSGQFEGQNIRQF
jgi:hypothetical protein